VQPGKYSGFYPVTVTVIPATRTYGN